MKYACIAQHVGAFPVVLMCRVLGVPRSGFYAWRRRPPSARARQDARLRVAIRASFAASQRRYGSPRIYHDLRAQAWACSRKRVARLMRAEGLRARRGRRYRPTTRADGTPPAPHRLRRQFAPGQPDRVWVSDVTAWWTAEGWLYLAVVLDLGSRRVVGWHAGPTVGQELTLPALRQALTRRGAPTGLLHHSDRGMHYTGRAYQQLLQRHGCTGSMSRRGNCWDNAVAESFFATLKTEATPAQLWRSRADAHDAIRQYLSWYNRQRLHSSLGYQSPMAYERGLTAA